MAWESREQKFPKWLKAKKGVGPKHTTSIPFEINHQESFPLPNFFLNTDGAKVPDFVSWLGKDKSQTLDVCGLWMTGRDKTSLSQNVCQNVTTTVHICWSLCNHHGLSLHGYDSSGSEPYQRFDHIWDMASTCAQRNLVIYIPVYNQILVSGGFCILFAHVPAIFIVYNVKHSTVPCQKTVGCSLWVGGFCVVCSQVTGRWSRRWMGNLRRRLWHADTILDRYSGERAEPHGKAFGLTANPHLWSYKL